MLRRKKKTSKIKWSWRQIYVQNTVMVTESLCPCVVLCQRCNFYLYVTWRCHGNPPGSVSDGPRVPVSVVPRTSSGTSRCSVSRAGPSLSSWTWRPPTPAPCVGPRGPMWHNNMYWLTNACIQSIKHTVCLQNIWEANICQNMHSYSVWFPSTRHV